MVGLGMPEREFVAAMEVVFLVVSAEKACCSEGSTGDHGRWGLRLGE